MKGKMYTFFLLCSAMYPIVVTKRKEKWERKVKGRKDAHSTFERGRFHGF